MPPFQAMIFMVHDVYFVSICVLSTLNAELNYLRMNYRFEKITHFHCRILRYQLI